MALSLWPPPCLFPAINPDQSGFLGWGAVLSNLPSLFLEKSGSIKMYFFSRRDHTTRYASLWSSYSFFRAVYFSLWDVLKFELLLDRITKAKKRCSTFPHNNLTAKLEGGIMTAWRILVRENRGRRLFFGQKKNSAAGSKKIIRAQQTTMNDETEHNLRDFFILNLIEE